MLSIIVLSSDGYSDCWYPLFETFKRNFPTIGNYELILSSNTKKYEHSGLNIVNLSFGENAAWSKRLKESLKQAKNEIVLVLVEDFFLLSEMNEIVFSNLLKSISKNEGIDHIRLMYNKNKCKVRPSNYENLDEIVPGSKYRFLYVPGLWKKKVLNRYLVNFETPYISEKIGDYRSWILKDKFFALSKAYLDSNKELYDCGSSGGLVKGKWEKWLPPRLEENHIEIDYTIRGFRDQEIDKKGRLGSQMALVKTPISTLKSFLSVLKLVFVK